MGRQFDDIRFNRGSLIAWVCAVVASAAAFPIAMVYATDASDEPAVRFIENLYARKDVMLTRASADSDERLVVIGGSGALFNIRAEMLEAATGVPTVNYGIHAGLGPHMLLSRARRHLREGDRVLLVPEYSALSVTPREALPLRPWQWAATFDPSALVEAGPLTSLKTAVRASWPPLRVLRDRFGQPDAIPRGPPAYPLGSLSAWGDLVWRPERRRELPLAWTNGTPDPSDPDWARHVRDFLAWADAEGIDVILLWPSCVPDDRVRSLAPDMLSALRSVAGRFSVPVLGEPQDWFLDDSEVSDTGNHATPAAAIDITWRVIDALRDAGLRTGDAIPPPTPRRPKPPVAALVGHGSVDPALHAAMLRAGASSWSRDLEAVDAGVTTLLTDDPASVLDALMDGWRLSGVAHPLHETARAATSDTRAVRITARRTGPVSPGRSPRAQSTIRDVQAVSIADGSGRTIPSASDGRIVHEFASRLGPSPGGRQRTVLHKIVANGSDRVSWITIDDARLFERMTAGGEAVAALDTRLGVVTRALRYDEAGQPVGRALFELERGHAGLVETEVDLGRFVPSGVSRPKLLDDARGRRVDFVGERSFAALPIDVAESGPGWHWLELEVFAGVETDVEAFSWTNGPGHLAGLRPAVHRRLRPGQNRIVVPLLLAADDAATVQAGVRGDADTPDIVITSARLLSLPGVRAGME
ncbi:MAG: hypothetical protein AAFR96_06525 [Planctomycetota bacterium]